MADLPELPESARRTLMLQWKSLLNQHKFNGEHLQWHDSQRDALSRGGRIGLGGGWRGPRGSFKVDERLVDREGIGPSVAIANSRLYQLAMAYWPLWTVSAGYEVYAGWLDLLKAQVLEEVASIWKGHSEGLNRWYERACKPALEKALSPKMQEYESWARNAELKVLEQATTTELLERASGAHQGASDNYVDETTLRSGALGVLSALLLRTKSSLPAKNPYLKDDPKHELWAGMVRKIAKHHADLAEKLPAENAVPREYDGWALDCLKAFFVGSAIEMAISLPNRDPESLAVYYDYLDAASEVVGEIGQQIAPHLTPSFFAFLPSRITKWREVAKAAIIAPDVAPHAFDGVRNDLQRALEKSGSDKPEAKGELPPRENKIPARDLGGASMDSLEPLSPTEPPKVGPTADAAKPGSSWEEIEITFISDERVQIVDGHERKTLNYAEFGFEDRRNGKPNLAWITLRELAKLGGEIKQSDPSVGWVLVERRAQEIRKALRYRFSLVDDPLPFVEKIGYRARFKISLGRSFNH